ncbi:protoporphyrinogen oxidase [Aliarcobacter thereius]|uniref:NAD(P)/FAD-dependent oxidoreductase n=2 Tax=Aliarcobacter thereius TaxID=544718 RepID=A0A5R9H8B5_9BACT|nr:NAD(P)/FAD-dependent oxidoreductase [Aliarcobacter thereius]OCL88350.1 protoporphyrinogen oxidase [Aliarcobacter thereius]OCL95062.1 protoporphyrinogen oxidase [Aliarcobacter thereius LMG 24486]QBF16946.1 flavoprotein, HI0933 family [Aliarcobacter thereius LMG 24486]TLS72708.1 NAD(P)/FAD-dependent oxidoreductase [Aliarcobacter thereius]TLS92885.1 NAD(P)/FAD-dependent oxidoreductase [Aliarcobacter thereius]
MKIAIIGGGAAGIIAVITAKRLNKDLQIDIFDANKSLGKKILASGNGRCNISNTKITSKNYLGENPDFVNFALKEFDFKAFLKFCKSIGLMLDIKESGKVYPLSNEAKSVVNLLALALEKLEVNIYYEHFIQKVEKKDDKFIIIANEKEFKNYSKVLVSSGLGAAPQLNSTEIGLEIASSFGHTYNLTYPSLVGLQTKENYNGKLQGVKKECKVSLYVNGTLEDEIFGDVLFTSYGVSGFAILDISQKAVLALSQYFDVELRVNLFPNLNVNDLADQIATLFKSLQKERVVDVLVGVVSNKIAPILLNICKIDLDTKIEDINTKQIKAISHQLNSWRLKIVNTQGFSHAEASGGGVKTSEINDKTYESKLINNLYFAGEVLDIVGNRGGFNLHFAWASGYIVGRALIK